MHHAPEQEGESSLMGHLIELRARLLRGEVPVSESWAFRWTA